MPRKRKKQPQYTPTQSVIIKDVPNVVAKMFNELMTVCENVSRPTKVAAFEEIVMKAHQEYFGKDLSKHSLTRFERHEQWCSEAAQESAKQNTSIELK